MTTALVERQADPGIMWRDPVEQAESIIRVEADRLASERLKCVGGLALWGADVCLPEDLCDLSEVRREYDEFVSSVVPRSEAEIVKPQADKRQSFYDMLAGAAESNVEARAGVDANAETIIAEHILKDGSIIEISAEMSPDGQIVQFGQTTRDRQQKTLEWYPDQSGALRSNTLAEGRNASVMEYLWRKGKLNGKKVLELSLVPMAAAEELHDYGYFLDRMTTIPRLTEIDEFGKVKIQSGLIGGVDQDLLPEYRKDESLEDEMARYKIALEERFDDEIAGEMLEILGVEGARFMNPTEKLSAVVILPEEVDILDIVQLWDRLASAKLGKPVFFGLSSLYKQNCTGRTPAREDYQAQRQRSQKQRAELKSTAKVVADETIRRRDEARNDLQAVRLLAEVAKNHTTRYVIERPVIDARVILGREAAVWAEEARLRHEWGDIAGAERFIVKAQEKSRPTGCPSGGSGGSSIEASGGGQKPDKDGGDDDTSRLDPFKKKSKEEKGKKTEWMRCVHCPLCKRDGVDARIDYYPGKKIKRITCTTCRGHKDYGM
jgi:hypothetical protein